MTDDIEPIDVSRMIRDKINEVSSAVENRLDLQMKPYRSVKPSMLKALKNFFDAEDVKVRHNGQIRLYLPEESGDS